jgi:hypothetical protein
MTKSRSMISIASAILVALAMAAPVGAQLASPRRAVRYKAINRTMYLRNVGAPDDTGSCSFDDEFLSDKDGPDAGNGCAFLLSSSAPATDATGDPLETGAFDFTEVWPAQAPNVKLPFIANAKKHITGKIAISSVLPLQASKLDVVVTLNGKALPAFKIDTGAKPGDHFFSGSPAPSYDVNIPIPASFNKKSIKSLSLAVSWRQTVNAGGSTWVEMDNPASYITIPALKKI